MGSITALGIPPSGFQDTIVLSGLTAPTAVRFSPDGRVFVAEKSGIIRVFSSLTDTTPTVFADLRTNVVNYWDRGLLGIELSPQFPADPSVYALYTYDAAIGAAAPRWNDSCPSPPGPTTDGCVVSGRLSRLTADGDVAAGPEQVLIEAWCQQYPSHSVADVRFGPDGALYATAGDGASFTFQDYGQGGGGGAAVTPRNPCGDPPAAVGGVMSAPTARGGRLRSQSLRRPGGEPVLLNGSLLRLDPATGTAMADNPLAGSPDENARRIVGYGMRNPFRFTFRPGTGEIWIGDAGDLSWEEIHRVVDPLDPTVANLGWPCYEGAGQHGQYRAQNLAMCDSLYANPIGLNAPYFAYHHDAKVVPGESCGTGSSVISGISFYDGSTYPATYRDALFFADHSRNCIWAMKAGANGLPDPAQIVTFVAAAANPVAIEAGPGGDLFYVDYEGGAIHRITYPAGNQTPTAVIVATPPTGAAPLQVEFDGSGSVDPEGVGLTYAWDLDGDGEFDDSTSAQPSSTYSAPGTYVVGLRVSDGTTTGTETTTVIATGPLPVPVIDSPLDTLDWAVGDEILFEGHATDGTGAELPASALTWRLDLRHCPSNCHTHSVETWSGVAGGSFDAPDHDFPSHLELVLTARDEHSQTASTSVELQPRTVDLTFATSPAGLQVAAGVDPPQTTPFTKSFIVGSAVGVAAPSPQTLGGTAHTFSTWSDAGAASHTFTAPSSAATYTATFTASTGPTTAYLSDLPYSVVATAWGPAEKDRSNGEQAAGDGRPLTLAGTVYPKGIGTHAASDIRYSLASCTTFTAKVGLDDEVGANGSVIFQIWGDATKLAESSVMTGASPTQTLTVDLTGRSQLRLVVDPNGVTHYDHADWADARLTCGGPPPPPDTTPPTITGLTPADGATGIAATTSPTVTFSEPINPATVTTTTVSLVVQGTTTPLAATVTYDAATRTATLDPTPALAASTAYTVTVRGGSSGVKDLAGVALVADRSWTFTTAAAPPPPDTTPPTITGLTPADGATGIAATTSPTVTFSEPINPATVTTTTVSLVVQGTTTPLAATVTYDAATRTATLDPTPALAASTAYTVTVRGGSSGVKDLAGVALVADRSWTFTTAAAPPPGPTTAYLSDLPYSVVATAWGPAEKDRSNGEQAAGDGRPLTLAGTVYPKGIGTHAASDIRYSLASCTTFTAKVGLDDEVGANGSVIFQIWGDATKLAESSVMTGASPTQTLTVDLTGRSQLRLVVDPNGVTHYDHADWADARLTCGGPPPPPDTTPPTITGLTPADGATGIAATTSPTVTFSEPINPATVTTTTVSLVVQGTTTPLAATVTYDAATRTATLDPTPALAASTAYTVTVRGGSSGVKDLAGVALVADRSWTFTTAAAPPPGPTTAYLSDLPYSVVATAWGPAEKDRSNGEQAAGDGRPLTLAGTVYPKGIGTHAASDIRYSLASCTTFTAKVGLDDEVGANGSVIFQIWGDATKLAESSVMTGASPTQTLTVDLTGRSQLRLVVDPNGVTHYDHADWADARLTCG